VAVIVSERGVRIARTTFRGALPVGGDERLVSIGAAVDAVNVLSQRTNRGLESIERVA
jgi:hypothetical protein